MVGVHRALARCLLKYGQSLLDHLEVVFLNLGGRMLGVVGQIS